MIQSLRDARLLKQWSQSEAGTRSGLTQSHLSKIEQGRIDPQLSNIVELARALDLELRLVPRKALPAVDSIIRSTTPEIVQQREARLKMELTRLVDLLRNAERTLSLTDRTGVIDALLSLQLLPIPERDIPRIRKAARHLQQVLQAEQPDDPQQSAGPDATARRAVQTLRDVRNRLVHSSPPASAAPRSAYAFDEDDDA